MKWLRRMPHIGSVPGLIPGGADAAGHSPLSLPVSCQPQCHPLLNKGQKTVVRELNKPSVWPIFIFILFIFGLFYAFYSNGNWQRGWLNKVSCYRLYYDFF